MVFVNVSDKVKHSVEPVCLVIHRGSTVTWRMVFINNAATLDLTELDSVSFIAVKSGQQITSFVPTYAGIDAGNGVITVTFDELQTATFPNDHYKAVGEFTFVVDFKPYKLRFDLEILPSRIQRIDTALPGDLLITEYTDQQAFGEVDITLYIDMPTEELEVFLEIEGAGGDLENTVSSENAQGSVEMTELTSEEASGVLNITIYTESN